MYHKHAFVLSYSLVWLVPCPLNTPALGKQLLHSLMACTLPKHGSSFTHTDGLASLNWWLTSFTPFLTCPLTPFLTISLSHTHTHSGTHTHTLGGYTVTTRFRQSFTWHLLAGWDYTSFNSVPFKVLALLVHVSVLKDLLVSLCVICVLQLTHTSASTATQTHCDCFVQNTHST